MWVIIINGANYQRANYKYDAAKLFQADTDWVKDNFHVLNFFA